MESLAKPGAARGVEFHRSIFGEHVNEAAKGIIRDTDASAIRLARRLVRTARSGALAALAPETGEPVVSRVGVATDIDGAPLILVSALSPHTPAIQVDARCSLLLGQPGKGDPLAHPRISLVCLAKELDAGSRDDMRARRRYLNRNPKANLYIGLADFAMFRLEPQRASLNGGFGKAYLIDRADLLATGPASEAVCEAEQAALDHMNADHLGAIAAIASHFTAKSSKGWIMTGIDIDGIDLALGDETERVFFPSPLDDARNLRSVLIDLAHQDRGS